MEVQQNKVKPRVFIGCSTESLRIAEAFQTELGDVVEPILWSDRTVFGASEYTLESLERALDQFQHALIILSPDDIRRSRGRDEVTARDNVIFELGLFIGRHGRLSSYYAVPDAVDLRVPSDFLGFTPVRYFAGETLDGQNRIDVRDACDEIKRQISSSTRRTPPRRSAFWSTFSDSIVILYGVEQDMSDPSGHARHRMSLRDIETAMELRAYLASMFPAKKILPFATTSPGWDVMLEAGADLVLVGGFVTNSEFAKNQIEYEKAFRLRMGRLCVVEKQLVHVPRFASTPDRPQPDPGDAEAIEDFNSEHVTRDFGSVYSANVHIYGRTRRVVAVAGVKGHGTRAAAMFLCDPDHGIDAYLQQPLAAGEVVEVAVSAEVSANRVRSLMPITLKINDRDISQPRWDDSRVCELGRPCEGCDFGLRPPRIEPMAGRATIRAADIRAIVLDLDDTLVDTFGSTIVRLEKLAAEAMVESGLKGIDPIALGSALLHCRRRDPANLEPLIKTYVPGITQRALNARRKVFSDPPIHHLVVSPEVTDLLRSLRKRYKLFLLTAGNHDVQLHKVEFLKLKGYFNVTRVVRDTTSAGKAREILRLIAKESLAPANVLVVGNRLDNEIAAANRIGCRSAWIQHGEGSELRPGSRTAVPDIALDDVLELGTLLGVRVDYGKVAARSADVGATDVVSQLGVIVDDGAPQLPPLRPEPDRPRARRPAGHPKQPAAIPLPVRE